MTLIANIATEKLRAILVGDLGVRAALTVVNDLENVSLPPFHAGQVIAQNASPDLAEHSSGSKYPILYIYCSKLLNVLREKFRTFSGEAEMTVEVRVSQDRLDDLENRVHMYVDAVLQVLNQMRGDWGDGVFYGGTYEVVYGAAKHGGRNFIQIAKITFALEMSVS